MLYATADCFSQFTFIAVLVVYTLYLVYLELSVLTNNILVQFQLDSLGKKSFVNFSSISLCYNLEYRPEKKALKYHVVCVSSQNRH